MSTEMANRKKRPPCFVIEGEWSGYHGDQRRVVHRTVHHPAHKKLREWAERTGGIRYSDGTMLYLRVRDRGFRERVQEIHGYDSLIRECASFNVNSVEALQEFKKAGAVA